VGTGRGAQAGVLVKNAEALELLAKVDTLVVDKTGTLTEGKPKLQHVVVVEGAAEGLDEHAVLAIAAALEVGSEHPLAAAIVEGAKQRGLALPKAQAFESHVGKGVTGRVGESAVGLGNLKLLEQLGVEPGALAEEAERLRNDGQTVMFVVRDQRVVGVIAVADPIKASTAQALSALTQAGVHVVMLTGDSQTTARAIAARLGIADVLAEVLPDQKSEHVARLQAEGKIVAMAGDGTNDAPALARAHVGIAMGTGTDVAMESAGVTLVRGDLMGIVRARTLSAHVMRNIRQNLFFAFVYNALGVPVAAGVLFPAFGLLLNPMIASAAMALSSVSVIGNALRLRSARL
jgi:Cu+-exporting ATPase